MSVIVCRTCGHEMSVPAGQELVPCIACGTNNSVPVQEADIGDMLRRATAQRLRCDFVHAESTYQHVLRDSPDEHEALWGLVQCRYAIEYVKDPRTGKPMPIVHGVQKRPMLTDPDFREACDLAPEAVRQEYRAEAEYIDGAMARIRELAEQGDAYDVFLCHKTSRTDGVEGYTEDYNRAVQLYIMLRDMGYRVFFAPFAGLTPGDNYEAGIYHALSTARVMLVICSNQEYINSPWVRTEWQRFLEMSYEPGADKHLIPLLYGELPPRRLPDDFRQLQAIVMGELNATERLMAAIRKHTGEKATARQAVEPKPAPKEETKPVEPPKPVSVPKSEPKKPAPKPKPAPVVKYAPESHFKIKEVDGGVAIIGYTGPGGEVLIPPTIGGKKVVEIGAEAFNEQVQMTKVVIPEGVTSIGEYAFYHCSGLASVNIPESMTSIGDYAFFDCSLLESVHIPESMTRLDENPFAFCSALKSITVAAGNRKYYTLDNVLLSRDGALVCYPMSLTAESYTIPDFVTCIGEYAFCCSKLKAVSIPESVTSIGDTAFANCSSLTSVEIPAGVKRIGDWTFRCCSSLTSMRIPESVTSIGDWAFWKCSNLTSVSIPESVTSIGDWAFGDCSDLTSVSIPQGVTSIGASAFFGCSNLTLRVHPNTPAHTYAQQNNLRFELIAPISQLKPAQAASKSAQPTQKPTPKPAQPAPTYAPENHFSTKAVDGGARITKYTGPGGEVLIPPTIGGQRVVEIGWGSFEEMDKLTEIVIPEGVARIGDRAFDGCSSLARVNLPTSVRSIDDLAFAECRWLTSVSLPEGVKKIGGGAFYGCPNLTLRVHPNTPAHIYAKKNNLRFELIAPAPQPVQKSLPSQPVQFRNEPAPKPTQKPSLFSRLFGKK